MKELREYIDPVSGECLVYEATALGPYAQARKLEAERGETIRANGHNFVGYRSREAWLLCRDKRPGVERRRGGFKAGEEHHLSKLTEKDVRWIRENPLGLEQSVLGKIFGVRYQCIGDVQKYKTWKHVA